MPKRMPKLLLYVVTAGLLLVAPLTRADTIGTLTNPCINDSCDGAQYTLFYNGQALPDSNPLTETFRVSLSIDTTNYTGGGSFLNNVAIKVSSTPNLVGASLFSAPGGSGDWTVGLNQTLNANGCSANGGGGFICAAGSANSGKGVALPGPYTLTFDVTVNNGTLFTDPLEASIKARYVDGAGTKTGSLLSENITLQVVPEAQSYAILALGLGFLAIAVRRRRSI
jgi:hypothetical protein